MPEIEAASQFSTSCDDVVEEMRQDEAEEDVAFDESDMMRRE